MAILDIDLRDSDKTISLENADEANVVNVTAWGSRTLTVDGVSADVNSIVNVQLFASPTFAVINGGDLIVNYGSVNLSLLAGVNYNVGDASSIYVNGPSLLAANLGTQTINFSGNGTGAFTYKAGLIDTTGVFDVNGFSWGDSVGVNGYEFDSFNYDADSSVGTLVLSNGAPIGEKTITFTFDKLDPSLAAEILKDPAKLVNEEGQFVAPVCFFKGTLIQTDRGELAVEDIQVGDKVVCLGGLREVRWTGYRHDWAHRIPEAKREEFWPVLIKKGAISDNVPNRDLRVSPWHHLYIKEVLVRAKDLVNGSTICSDNSVKRISYYHIELDQFDVISAHGIFSESYADGGNRDYFHNVDVSSLAPQDRIRRQATRPGFHAVRDKETIVALRKQFAARAALMQAELGAQQKVA